jgi:hypothetical protein
LVVRQRLEGSLELGHPGSLGIDAPDLLAVSDRPVHERVQGNAVIVGVEQVEGLEVRGDSRAKRSDRLGREIGW